MADDFSLRDRDLLTVSDDCADRILLKRVLPAGIYQPGGLRAWWRRLHDGSDEELDNTRLMRMAGPFARRVKARGAADAVPVIFCKAGERKHRPEPRTRDRDFRGPSGRPRDQIRCGTVASSSPLIRVGGPDCRRH